MVRCSGNSDGAAAVLECSGSSDGAAAVVGRRRQFVRCEMAFREDGRNGWIRCVVKAAQHRQHSAAQHSTAQHRTLHKASHTQHTQAQPTCSSSERCSRPSCSLPASTAARMASGVLKAEN
jgi:hypothetical protein